MRSTRCVQSIWTDEGTQLTPIAGQVTGPVLRFAQMIASQGYIVACPCVYHEFAGSLAIPYDTIGTDAGNAYKVDKLLSAYDSDAKEVVDFLVGQKGCNGRIGSTGMCLGGHLAFRCAFDERILASVCYFPTGEFPSHSLIACWTDETGLL